MKLWLELSVDLKFDKSKLKAQGPDQSDPQMASKEVEDGGPFLSFVLARLKIHGETFMMLEKFTY